MSKNNDISIEELFGKIKLFNNISFDRFEGYRMGNFFAVSYNDILHTNIFKSNLFILILKNIVRCFIVDMNYVFEKAMYGKILLFYSHEHARRPDYVNFMEDMSHIIDNSYLCTGTSIKRKYVFSKQSIANLLLLFRWRKQIQLVERNPKNIEILLSKISQAYRWKNLIEQHSDTLNTVKGLVTIFDAREYENILTQYLKNQNINTATLQHGHYSFISEKEKYIGLPFIGFVSDELWAWGDYTKKCCEGSGLDPSVIKPCGYPKHIEIITHDFKNAIGVILEVGHCAVTINKILINLASRFCEKYNKKLVIKPHPHDYTDYSIYVEGEVNSTTSYDNILDFARTIDFSICFGSTAYIDIIANGGIVYRYISSELENGYKYLSSVDSFKDMKGLCALYNNQMNGFNNENRLELLGNINSVAERYNSQAGKLFK